MLVISRAQSTSPKRQESWKQVASNLVMIALLKSPCDSSIRLQTRSLSNLELQESWTCEVYLYSFYLIWQSSIVYQYLVSLIPWRPLLLHLSLHPLHFAGTSETSCQKWQPSWVRSTSYSCQCLQECNSQAVTHRCHNSSTAYYLALPSSSPDLTQLNSEPHSPAHLRPGLSHS